MKYITKSITLAICLSTCTLIAKTTDQKAPPADHAEERPSTNVAIVDTPAPTDTHENLSVASVPEEDVLELEAVGIGIAPSESCSPAQAVALAKRAATIDAYRHLGEQMYGIKINANDSVQNMVLKNSSIKTKLNALIRGAKVRESACDQGICQVTMELKLDGRIWLKALGIADSSL